MLVYYDGSQWRSTQVSNRTSDTAVDYSGANVRDLGRPLVMVDGQNRVLVVMRYRDASNPNNHDPNNSIVLAYNEDLMHGSVISDANWKYLTLNTANMGNYEPTFDVSMWNSKGILDLFYEPAMGISPFTTQPVSVLEWNEQKFFAVLNTINNHIRGDFNFDGVVTNTDLQAMLSAMQSPSTFKSAYGLSDSDYLTLGNYNGDGLVDSADLNGLMIDLTSGAAGSPAAPRFPNHPQAGY